MTLGAPLGTASRVSEMMNGKRRLSMTMVRKLRDRDYSRSMTKANIIREWN
jgi:antitoxin component HigA of HigAB toxin-antitoxin module